MKFNKKQRIGIMSLLFVIFSIQMVILNFHKFNELPISEERNIQLEYYISQIDSLKKASVKKEFNYFKFNPNKLSYRSWSFFGLNPSQLYSLDSFRADTVFSSKLQVKEVLRLSDSIYSIVDSLMYFPKKYTLQNSKRKKKIIYTVFNPNIFNKEEWEQLGFSEKQSEIIFNYIDIRGGIKDKEELKEIFVINDDKYKELESFVNIPKKEEDEIIQLVTLNTATIEDFKAINGIGDVYSKIIVDYRESLGGFRFYYQLKETKIVDSTLYKRIRKEFPLEKEFAVRKISINNATLEELQSHPYIGWRLGESIFHFRTNFRNFNTLEEIKNIEVISDAYFNKIELYLTLD